MAKTVTSEMKKINAKRYDRSGNLKKSTPATEAWKRLKKNKPAIVGMIIVTFMLLVAIFANIIAPYKPDLQDYSAMFKGPSAQHLFGTDQFGRDVFSRCVYGSRYSLLIALVCLLTGMLTGGVLGVIAGYFGGKVDSIIMRIMDVLQSMPTILLAMAIISVLGNGIPQLVAAITISSVSIGARSWRSTVLMVRSNEYIESSRSVGADNLVMIVRHVIPNCVGISVVGMVSMISHSILMISSLCYIGLGISPPTPEWGVILNNAKTYFLNYPYMALFPTLVIMITVLGFNLLGNGLRDALDPRMK
jgi:ABC-type dipeptide/oligopeptide/nickel transport system permease subunit